MSYLEQDQRSAEELGLTGAAMAAKAKIQSMKARIDLLNARIEIVEKGYECWPKFEFELTCEDACLFTSWHQVGDVIDGVFSANEDLEIRVPQEALHELRTALDSALFGRLTICEAIEPAADIDDDVADSMIYYLFGTAPAYDPLVDTELFFIDSWSMDKSAIIEDLNLS